MTNLPSLVLCLFYHIGCISPICVVSPPGIWFLFKPNKMITTVKDMLEKQEINLQGSFVTGPC